MKATTAKPQRKILCIGDESETLLLCERVITTKLTNVEVACAYDGKQGLQRAFENKPDLIIIDGGHLPNVGDINLEDSRQLALKVRNELRPHILAMIMLEPRELHGDIDPADKWFELADGPLSEMLMKPVYIPELVKIVKTLFETLDRKRAE